MRMKARALISKMASSAEQIKNLSCPEPTNFDPEEDDFDTTRATLVNKYNQGDEEDQSFGSGALRKKAVSLLSDEDQKYEGRTVSRSDLAIMRGDFMDSDDSADELDDEDEDGDEEKYYAESSKIVMENEEQSTSEHSDIEDDADDSDASDDDDDDDDDNDGGDMLSNTLGDNSDNKTAGISSFSASKTEDEIEKGTAVKHQLNLWDSFLEYRIRLQKALLLTNKLPQHDVNKTFACSSDGNMKPETQKGQKALTNLLYKLLIIQEKLLERNPETRKTLYPGTNNGIKKDDDDEEIPSDSENEEKEDDTAQPEGENSLKLPEKRKGVFSQEEFSECISKRHASFQDVRDTVISKWSEKTRFASGKLESKSFSSFDRSALSQIKQVLSDKQRLIKRSQLKRSSYKVLGKHEKEKSSDTEQEEEANAHLKDYDKEIFDDDDFYHQLLRELIERRTASNSDDPIEMGRQWLELQKLRRKIKKKVDTKASKGRKLRYNVLSKLVSYMPPIERGSMPDSSRNELFSSLFGQIKVQPEICDIDVFR